MICGNDYFLDLTPEKVDVILDDLRKRWQANQDNKSKTLLGIPGPKV